MRLFTHLYTDHPITHIPYTSIHSLLHIQTTYDHLPIFTSHTTSYSPNTGTDEPPGYTAYTKRSHLPPLTYLHHTTCHRLPNTITNTHTNAIRFLAPTPHTTFHKHTHERLTQYMHHTTPHTLQINIHRKITTFEHRNHILTHWHTIPINYKYTHTEHTPTYITHIDLYTVTHIHTVYAYTAFYHRYIHAYTYLQSFHQGINLHTSPVYLLLCPIPTTSLAFESFSPASCFLHFTTLDH